MKIHRLKVTNYKNIADLELHFSTQLVSLLIGQNGVGKSNLIEILALIFRGLDLSTTEEELLDWPRNGNHFEYEIDYTCKGQRISIKSEVGSFTAQLAEENGQIQELSTADFITHKADRYLPDYVIGYYSGENNRIHEIVDKYTKKAWENIRRNRGSRTDFRRLFFVEDEHAQLLLLTLLLYQNNEHQPPEVKSLVDKLLREYANFEEVDELHIALKNPSWYKGPYEPDEDGNYTYDEEDWSSAGPPDLAVDDEGNLDIDELPDLDDMVVQLPIGQLGITHVEENLLSDEVPYPFWDIRGLANELIFFLNDNMERYLRYYAEEDPITEELIEIINFDGLNIDNLAEQVYAKFDHPLNLFNALDTLQLVESLHEVNLRVKHRYAGDRFQLEQLSEGERQLFTVLGLLLITSQGDTLYLLDEPETHLNPRWQRDYISLLREFSLNQENSHIVVASHSPLLVQEAKDIDLFLFRREGNQTIVDTDNYAIANWRIDHVLASKYFDLPSTRPKAIDEYIQLRTEILSQAEISAEDKQRLRDLADEYGTLPSGETIQEIEMQITLNRLADHLTNDTDNQEA